MFSPLNDEFFEEGDVFPAQAGVILAVGKGFGFLFGFPRTGGGDPT